MPHMLTVCDKSRPKTLSGQTQKAQARGQVAQEIKFLVEDLVVSPDKS